jgi:hypothetical protein
MRLKYAITIGDPKSAQIVSYQARSTGNSHLTRDDIVISLGITQSRCRYGLALIYAKYTKDMHAASTALAGIDAYAASVAGQFIPKNGRNTPREAFMILSTLALEEFCRTSDTPGAKCRCGGTGTVAIAKNKKNLAVKKCPRCKGSGLRPLTETRCHHALLKIISLSQPTYSRRWSPLYQTLIAWCYRQEAIAEQSYNLITELHPPRQEPHE